MARTIADIQKSIIAQVQADATLGTQLTSTSAVAIWRLWTYVVAVCQYVTESLFDAHVAEVNSIIATQKPHTLLWYTTIAKAFQYGDALPPDSDVYAVIDPTKQVVNYAAATEFNNSIRIKAATLSAGAGSPLAALSTPQLTAFSTYMNRVKDAGIRLIITSAAADRLVANLNIYYDALILNNAGQRLDGTNNTPIQQAITNFLDALPFNGLFVLNRFIDAIGAVDGVVIVNSNSVQATFGLLPLTNVTLQYLPDAGYITCDTTADLTLNFYAHEPI